MNHEPRKLIADEIVPYLTHPGEHQPIAGRIANNIAKRIERALALRGYRIVPAWPPTQIVCADCEGAGGFVDSDGQYGESCDSCHGTGYADPLESPGACPACGRRSRIARRLIVHATTCTLMDVHP